MSKCFRKLAATFAAALLLTSCSSLLPTLPSRKSSSKGESSEVFNDGSSFNNRSSNQNDRSSQYSSSSNNNRSSSSNNKSSSSSSSSKASSSEKQVAPSRYKTYDGSCYLNASTYRMVLDSSDTACNEVRVIDGATNNYVPLTRESYVVTYDERVNASFQFSNNCLTVYVTASEAGFYKYGVYLYTTTGKVFNYDYDVIFTSNSNNDSIYIEYDACPILTKGDSMQYWIRAYRRSNWERLRFNSADPFSFVKPLKLNVTNYYLEEDNYALVINVQTKAYGDDVFELTLNFENGQTRTIKSFVNVRYEYSVYCNDANVINRGETKYFTFRMENWRYGGQISLSDFVYIYYVNGDIKIEVSEVKAYEVILKITAGNSLEWCDFAIWLMSESGTVVDSGFGLYSTEYYYNTYWVNIEVYNDPYVGRACQVSLYLYNPAGETKKINNVTMTSQYGIFPTKNVTNHNRNRFDYIFTPTVAGYDEVLFEITDYNGNTYSTWWGVNIMS